MSKTTSTSLEETISEQQFFIELYNAKINPKLFEALKEDAYFFKCLGCSVKYMRIQKDEMYSYYLVPEQKKYGTIGFHINKG